MIYLIRSYRLSGKSILKIGFTDNIQKRINQYFYMNPGCELISSREGDEVLESLLHLYLRYLGFQYKKNGKLNEWFLDIPEVYQIFHISRESLERIIWKNREKMFNSSKFSLSNTLLSNLEYNLFENLWEKNKEGFEGEEIIFINGKPVGTKAKKIDILFWKVYSNKNPDKNIIPPPDNIFPEYEKIAENFLDNHFYMTGIFREKLKMYCEFCDLYKDNPEVIDILNHRVTNPRFHQFYRYFGTKGCSSRGYEEKQLLGAWGNDSKEDKLQREIFLTFKEGDRFSVKELKEIIRSIYSSLGIIKTAKATDLGKYFKLTKTRITLQDKTVVNGFKLDSL